MATHKRRIVSSGRLQIPANVRKELGFADGDDVQIEIVGRELRVRSFEASLARIREIARTRVPDGTLVSEELIADRRAEAGVE
jgi:bifunctional DNA-binding transcriptional regulator/antitoxin component of YhaV-PrlF toxin-antitoxin module